MLSARLHRFLLSAFVFSAAIFTASGQELDLTLPAYSLGVPGGDFGDFRGNIHSLHMDAGFRMKGRPLTLGIGVSPFWQTEFKNEIDYPTGEGSIRAPLRVNQNMVFFHFFARYDLYTERVVTPYISIRSGLTLQHTRITVRDPFGGHVDDELIMYESGHSHGLHFTAAAGAGFRTDLHRIFKGLDPGTFHFFAEADFTFAPHMRFGRTPYLPGDIPEIGEAPENAEWIDTEYHPFLQYASALHMIGLKAGVVVRMNFKNPQRAD